MNVLSVVCARAGSKGLKDKCIARINNKMVVEYAIEYSLSLGDNIKTVVSTDIEPLIYFCRRNKIDYIRRNPSLCTDKARIDDALIDAIKKRGRDCNYCSLVYGNIPIRYPGIFHKALSFLESHIEYDAVISMQNIEKFHPEWMFDFHLTILPRKECKLYRRQMLPQKMIHDGHTLIFRIDGFYKRYRGLIKYDRKCMYSVFGEKIKPLINNELIVDIDTEKDLKLAKAILLNYK